MFDKCDSPGSGEMDTATLAPPVSVTAPVYGVGAEWHPDAKAATTRVVAAKEAFLVMPESYRCGLEATRAKRSFCDAPF